MREERLEGVILERLDWYCFARRLLARGRLHGFAVAIKLLVIIFVGGGLGFALCTCDGGGAEGCARAWISLLDARVLVFLAEEKAEVFAGAGVGGAAGIAPGGAGAVVVVGGALDGVEGFAGAGGLELDAVVEEEAGLDAGLGYRVS